MPANTKRRFVSRSVLTGMIEDYLSNKPTASGGEVFDSFVFLVGLDTRLESYNPDTQTLTYWHNGQLRNVKRENVYGQFLRIRKRITNQISVQTKINS